MDCASRHLSDPRSVQFVCILNGGADVCEQRRKDGLMALAVLWENSTFTPEKVMPALDHILTKDSHESSVLLLTEYSLTPSGE